jgi:two-component system, LytTR family, response regulator
MKCRSSEITDWPVMRVLIADNESNERSKLVELCHSGRRLDDLIVVDSGTKAIERIRASRPDVALLACELEDMTGFDVLRALRQGARPATIMVAPDNRYAAQALTAAADLLTLPISSDRFAWAFERACSSARPQVGRTAAKRVTSVEKSSRRYQDCQPLGQLDRLVGERAGRLYFFSPLDIDYIEADSNYVRIHVGAERYINRDSLTRLSSLLANLGFVRISRAILLNLPRVSFAQREGRGVLAFVLESGARVVSSTGFRLLPGATLRTARTRGTRRKHSIR